MIDKGGPFSKVDAGQEAMAIIPKGAIFAAENIDKDSFCFMSCATAPKFTYDGFRLVDDNEIKDICPNEYEKIRHLAYQTARSDRQYIGIAEINQR